MAQQELEAMGAKHNNQFIVNVNPNLSVKVWKKGKEGIHVTLQKVGVKGSFTIHMDTFVDLMTNQDVVCLASDFLRGLVGFSPEDFVTVKDWIK